MRLSVGKGLALRGVGLKDFAGLMEKTMETIIMGYIGLSV